MMAGAVTWTDGEILRVLDRRAEGASAGEVASSYGTTRSAILGLEKRIRDEMLREDGTIRPGEVPAVKPENQDGGMPKDWWKPGLARQRGRK
jgi:hypothetical protein